MSVQDELHHLVDQLDEDGAREALASPQDRCLAQVQSGWRDLPREE